MATVRSAWTCLRTGLAVDVGCGAGVQAFRLAAHFGLRVVGIDPVQRHLDRAREERPGVASPRRLRRGCSFERGAADRIPLRDATVDLVWCRDSLPHVPSASPRRTASSPACCAPVAGRWCARSLATDLLAPDEADWLFPVLGVVPASVDLDTSDGAIRHSGLVVEASVDLGSEWVEHEEETAGAPSRALLHAARLQRDPDRYRAAFGDAAYDVMLGECLWLVYLMLGKLTSRVHLLSRP